jgi:kinetochore protein Nuf2
MPPQYCFPKLKNRDILACLRELDIPMTLSELKEPTMDIMMPVYFKLLELLMGVNKDSLKQPNFNAMNECWKYPELHEVSVYEITSIKKVLELFRACGIHEASIRTLMTPTAKDVKLILSGIINFAKFREERMATYSEFTKQTDELLQLKNQLEDHLDSLTPKLKELKDAREAELPKIHKLETETSNASKSIQDLNKKFQVLSKDNKKLKASIIESNETIATQNYELLNIQSKIDAVRVKIVKSPEKLKGLLVKMDENCNELTSDIHNARKQYRVLQRQTNVLETLNENLNQRMNEMNKSITEVNKNKAIREEIGLIENELQSKSENIDENTRIIEHMNEQISKGNERLLQQSKDNHQKYEAAKIAFQTVNQQKLNFSKEYAKDKQQLIQNQEFIQDKMNEMNDLKLKHQIEINALTEKYEEFGDQVNEYHETLLTAFQNQSLE